MTKELFNYDELDLIEMAKQCKVWGGKDGLETYLHNELLKATLPTVDEKDRRLWGMIEEIAPIAETHFPLLYATKKEKTKGGNPSKRKVLLPVIIALSVVLVVAALLYIFVFRNIID